jgi:poly-gamma-glutamate capsule biosynthesis protein CapA/YwtB (metallophosphatase superfamily)
MAETELRIALAGDVMLGRGIDQILPVPGDPAIDERWRDADDARLYIDLAERRHGAIPTTRDERYVWGDVLAMLEDFAPDVRLINLETAVTQRGRPYADKLIHYRMNPDNVGVLGAAGIDVCALANNHVLDWDLPGLADTLAALDRAGIRRAGAGRNLAEAAHPALVPVEDQDGATKGRVVVISAAMTSSGTPRDWAAAPDRPGVFLVGPSDAAFDFLRRLTEGRKQPGDILIFSIHWGRNFGHGLADPIREFAHRLIDEIGVDLVHGHSSHHVRAIELYKNKPILYGCGDLINDYEGIDMGAERDAFRPDLGLLYGARFDAASGDFLGLAMQPTTMHRLRVRRGTEDDARILAAVLNREGAALDTQVTVAADGTIALAPD